MKFRIGRHINISKGFVTTPWYAEKLGCTIFQIFLGIPQRILSKKRQENELIEFREQLEERDMMMVVHGSYTINLSHPSTSPKYKASLKSLIQDLDSSLIIGERCLGVIIHMGKNIPENKITNRQALDNYIYGIKQALLETKNSTIILETGASQGNEVGSDIDGLTYIYWSFNERERERIMFCIDTCHIWATGYDISNSSGVKNFFNEFDEKIGIKKISVIHFNDSKTGLNSHVDRHADLGYGHIRDNGLRQIAKFAKKHKIPIVMETPLDAIDKNTNQEITFEDEYQKVLSWIK